MMTKMTRWFQVHPWAEMAPRQNPAVGHLDFLRTTSLPVYLEELNPAECPTGVKYPYEAVCQMLGGNYLTSAPSFMLALAIFERFEVIKVYGIDMDCEREWAYERSCFEHLLGFALGRGAKIWLPPGCPLLKGPLYAKTADVPSSYLVERHRQLLRRQTELVAELNMVAGKLAILEELTEFAFEGPARLGNAQVGHHISEDGHVEVDPLGILAAPEIETVRVT